MKLFPKWKDQKTWQKFANAFALIFLSTCLLIIIFFYNADSMFGPAHEFLIFIISLAPYPNLITSKLIPESISQYIFYDHTIIIPIIGLITYYLIGALTGLIVGKIKDKLKNNHN